jgi:Lrp/AsnC family leucine-responsive transcriptional regulator
MQIGRKERAILFELDQDSRQSNAQIARKVGLSKEIVNYQIRRFQEKGIIARFTTIIDTARLGIQSARVMLFLTGVDPAVEGRLLRKLVEKEEVFFVAQFKGSADINFGFGTKSPFALQEFIKSLKTGFPGAIDRVEVEFYDSLHHLHRKHLMPGKRPRIEIMGKKEPAEHDTFDLALLKLLAQDARMPATAIAEKLKRPVTTVLSRLRGLEKKGIILGYTILLKPQALGLDYYKIDLQLSDPVAAARILEFCKDRPEAVHFMKTVGNTDVEIYVESAGTAAFLELARELRQQHPEIRRWSHATFMQYHKFRYF